MTLEAETNPYAPPEADDLPPADDRNGARRFDPATLGSRFWGAMIDGLINLGLASVVRMGLATLSEGTAPSFLDLYGPRALEHAGWGTLVGSAIPLGIMAALIAQRSQSIGKILLGTRIVTADGRPAGLTRGFVLRTLPFFAIGALPSALIALGTPAGELQVISFPLSLVALIDALLILGNERRCLHDRIAGTYVAAVGTERPAGGSKKKKKRKKSASGA